MKSIRVSDPCVWMLCPTHGLQARHTLLPQKARGNSGAEDRLGCRKCSYELRAKWVQAHPSEVNGLKKSYYAEHRIEIMNKPETQREWVEYVMKRQEYRERLHPGDHYARDWAYEYEGPVPRLQATGVTGWPCDEGWILFMHKLGSGESMSNYP